jgi:hypothetical protein
MTDASGPCIIGAATADPALGRRDPGVLIRTDAPQRITQLAVLATAGVLTTAVWVAQFTGAPVSLTVTASTIVLTILRGGPWHPKDRDRGSASTRDGLPGRDAAGEAVMGVWPPTSRRSKSR